MWLFFTTVVLAVLACGGLTAASQPDGVLHPLRKRLESGVQRRMLSKNIAYPLLLCDVCMASLWGSISYWVLMWVFHVELSWEVVAMWPFQVLAVAVINLLLWTVISTLGAVREYFQWKTYLLKKQHSNGKPG